jgi:hypothetical protein
MAKRRARAAAQAPAEEEDVSLYASARAHEVLALVLPLLPVAQRVRSMAVCKAWRDAGAAGASIWADLEFRGGGAPVDTASLTALCARAGAALRGLHLDVDAAVHTLSAAAVLHALSSAAGACSGLQRLTLPAPDNTDCEYEAAKVEPLMLTPAQAAAFAAACPQLREAACTVLCASDADADAAAAALPGPLTLCFTHSWCDGAPDDTDADADADADPPPPAYWGAPSVAGMLLLHGGDDDNDDGVPMEGRPTEAAVLRLAAALQQGGALQQLDVFSAELFDAGAEALAAALRAHTCTLRSLHVNAPDLSDAGSAALAAALAANTSLRSLRLRGAESLSRATGNAVAAALRANATLTTLELEGVFDDATMVALGAAIRDNGALMALSVTNASAALGVAGAEALAAALRPGARCRLVTLSLSVCHHARRAALAALCDAAVAAGGAPALECLSVAATVGNGDDDPAAAQQLPAGARWLDSLCALLRANGALHTLRLTGMFTHDATLIALAGALRDNNTLRTLDISDWDDTQRKNAGVAALAAALRDEGSGAAASLTSLDLSGLRVGEAGSRALCAMLRDNATLRVLHAPRVPSRDEDAASFGAVEPLCAALRVNATLRQLSFGTDGWPRSTHAVGRALQHNRALTALEVENVALGAGGAAALATGLRRNTRLRELRCLAMRQLDGSDLVVLAGALARTRTLARLAIEEGSAPQGLYAEAAEALGRAVRANDCASALVALQLPHSDTGRMRRLCARAMAGRQPFETVLL